MKKIKILAICCGCHDSHKLADEISRLMLGVVLTLVVVDGPESVKAIQEDRTRFDGLVLRWCTVKKTWSYQLQGFIKFKELNHNADTLQCGCKDGEVLTFELKKKMRQFVKTVKKRSRRIPKHLISNG